MSTLKMKKPKVHAKIRKAKDLETHITTRFVAGHEFVEIRDYVPSTGVYSRGWTGEMRLLPQVLEALQDLHQRTAANPSNQVEGQLALDV